MGNPADVCRIIKVVFTWYLSSLTEKNKGGGKQCHPSNSGHVTVMWYSACSKLRDLPFFYFSCVWQCRIERSPDRINDVTYTHFSVIHTYIHTDRHAYIHTYLRLSSPDFQPPSHLPSTNYSTTSYLLSSSLQPACFIRLTYTKKTSELTNQSQQVRTTASLPLLLIIMFPIYLTAMPQ